MTFSPVIPQSGLLGWTFLSRTLEAQKDNFMKSGAPNREAEAFRERISSVKTADDLVGDRELLSVALTAFGLEDDLNNTFLVKKVLSDGSFSEDALANRFSDKRYLKLTKAFGFVDFDVPRTQLSDFSEEIISKYIDQKFERAVGDQDESLRLALSLDQSIGEIVNKEATEATKWFSVLGNPPLKSIFDTAFFLPPAFSNLSLDRQVNFLKSEVLSKFDGESIDIFQEQSSVDRLRTKFLLASQLNNQTVQTGASTALSLLRNGLKLAF